MRAITAVIVVSLMAAGPAFADPTAARSPVHSSHSHGKKDSHHGKKKPPPADHPKAASGTQATPAQGKSTGSEHPRGAAPAKAHARAPQPGLAGMSAAAAGAAGSTEPGNPPGVSAHLDLSPQRQATAISHAADRRGSERTTGLTYGGTSWKSEAVGIGVMAATFGALLGLCGSGNCTLPAFGPSDHIGAPANLDIRREEPHPRSAR